MPKPRTAEIPAVLCNALQKCIQITHHGGRTENLKRVSERVSGSQIILHSDFAVIFTCYLITTLRVSI